MTELENLMVEKMKEILANQTRLSTQLDELSKHLKSVDLNQEGFANILEEHSKSVDLNQEGFAIILEEHLNALNSLLPPGSSLPET